MNPGGQNTRNVYIPLSWLIYKTQQTSGAQPHKRAFLLTAPSLSPYSSNAKPVLG